MEEATWRHNLCENISFKKNEKKSGRSVVEEAEDDNFEQLELDCKANPCIKLSRSSSGTLIKVICIQLHFAGRCNLQVAVCPQKCIHPRGGRGA